MEAEFEDTDQTRSEIGLSNTEVFLWLNQKAERNSSYRDKHGHVYHFRGGIPGYKIIDEGCRFIYYQPETQSFIGTGRIAEIETQTPELVADQPENGIPPFMINYYAYIDDYRAFDPPVSAREVKDQIPMLCKKAGLRGVPQHGITKIDRRNFEAILAAADSEKVEN